MIEYLDECASTQTALIEALKSRVAVPDCAIIARRQSSGIGSRGNSWQSEDGNLYFSFCMAQSSLAMDIPPVSLSIYFAYVMKIYLEKIGSKVWLKWPNDFYLNNRKIGGVITNKIGEIYVCGMGINLEKTPEFGDILDVKITPNELVNGFFDLLEQKISWKRIFSKYLIEFELSKKFNSHINGKIVSLEDAILCDDGSIKVGSERVYSLR